VSNSSHPESVTGFRNPAGEIPSVGLLGKEKAVVVATAEDQVGSRVKFRRTFPSAGNVNCHQKELRRQSGDQITEGSALNRSRRCRRAEQVERPKGQPKGSRPQRKGLPSMVARVLPGNARLVDAASSLRPGRQRSSGKPADYQAPHAPSTDGSDVFRKLESCRFSVSSFVWSLVCRIRTLEDSPARPDCGYNQSETDTETDFFRFEFGLL
jgi:hypothetical protein